MPTYRLAPDGAFEQAVEQIQETERIVAAPVIDGCIVIITEERVQKRAAAGEVEKRPAK